METAEVCTMKNLMMCRPQWTMNNKNENQENETSRAFNMYEGEYK
jgi:hypothetical protein